MPAPPGMSEAEYAASKKAQAEAAAAEKERKAKEEADKKAAKEARAKYSKRADPATVEDLVGTQDLENEYFKEGEWRAAWAIVEFVCLTFVPLSPESLESRLTGWFSLRTTTLV